MIDDKWRTIDCPKCGGHGMRMVADGTPFECSDCSMGRLFIRPSGHLFAYPGGPARGIWSPEKYEEDGEPVPVHA